MQFLYIFRCVLICKFRKLPNNFKYILFDSTSSILKIKSSLNYKLVTIYHCKSKHRFIFQFGCSNIFSIGGGTSIIRNINININIDIVGIFLFNDISWFCLNFRNILLSSIVSQSSLINLILLTCNSSNIMWSRIKFDDNVDNILKNS